MSTNYSRIPKRPAPQRPPIEWPVRKTYERKLGATNSHQEQNKSTTPNPQPTPQFDWVNYHNQWQKYYQDYFHNYFQQLYEAQKQQEAKAATFKKRSRRIHRISLGTACLCALMLLFAQFNPIIISAIRQNLTSGNASPIIIERPNNVVAKDPKIIIPRLNIEAAADFEFNSLDEKAYLMALESAVTRYASNNAPGEQGNLVLGGHSGANLFSSGDYKFVFSRLNALQTGDIILLNYRGYQYRYEVFENTVVEPNETDVLGTSNEHLLTLFTCDPPGINTGRRIVKARQTNPAPQESNRQTQIQTIPEKIPALNSTLF